MNKLIALLLSIPLGLWAVQLPTGTDGSETTESSGSAEPKTEAKAAVPPDSKTETVSIPSKVSILCYHDFSAKKEATEMRIREELFAQQMQQVADSGINVISMSDFIAWKQGTKDLPEQNILITIDDGWRSVFLVAYPVLKKHEFPFSLGLYKNFIGKGELSLNKSMINEMLMNGMQISSHSVSHPYPSVVKKKRQESDAAYNNFLRTEFGEAKSYLEDLFKQSIPTYIYPGGYYTPDMFPVLRSYGYEFAFTVKPGKVTRDSVDMELPRYVVLGTSDRMFQHALNFEGQNSTANIKTDLAYPVKPPPGTETSERLPWIGVDFEGDDTVDRDSVYMRVGGFGKVDAKFLKDTHRFEWQAMRPLRVPACSVLVQWRKKGSSKYEPPLKWTFLVDQKQQYLKASGVEQP